MISIIASCSKQNRAIGKNGKIPWSLPGDLRYFKSVTLNSAVIMGRLTWESIGHCLPERLNIVLSKSQIIKNPDVITAESLEKAIQEAKNHGFENIFIIGGEKVYQKALPLAEKIYLTEIDINIENADAFFPDFSKYNFFPESESKIIFENNLTYQKKIYIKK